MRPALSERVVGLVPTAVMVPCKCHNHVQKNQYLHSKTFKGWKPPRRARRREFRTEGCHVPLFTPNLSVDCVNIKYQLATADRNKIIKLEGSRLPSGSSGRLGSW